MQSLRNRLSRKKKPEELRDGMVYNCVNNNKSLENGNISFDNGDIESPNLSSQSMSVAYNLEKLLADASALSFFIQYLESCDRLNLIKFWMHIEGFKSSFICALDSDVSQTQSLYRLDAQNIYDKYIEEESICSICVPKKIRRITQDNMHGTITQDCFYEAQMFVKSMFELRYFEEFRSSIYFKKHELDVLSRRCSIDDVIQLPSLLPHFMEILEGQVDINCIQFLTATSSFESDFNALSDEQLLEDAMLIYDRYLSMQSTSALPMIGDDLRITVESSICAEGGRPLKESFTLARQVVCEVLEKKYIAAFVLSEAYRGYLSDLFKHIDSVVELPRRDSSRPTRSSVTSSDAASTDSLPLLFRKHCEKLETTGVDNGVVNDRTPSSPRTSTSLAEVDNMGRYRPLYDDSFKGDMAKPAGYLILTQRRDLWPYSVTRVAGIRNRLRKYLDKASMREEEIAEEVARSIIADVKSMVDASNDEP